MKRKEFYDTLNNIILDMFPYLKDICEVEFIANTNSELNGYGDSVYKYKNRDTKFHIYILRKPIILEEDKDYLDLFNIPYIDGKIIYTLLYEYGNVDYVLKLNKFDSRLDKKNLLTSITTERFVFSLLAESIKSEQDDFELETLNIQKLNAERFAYRYFPIVVNKLNEIKNNKK